MSHLPRRLAPLAALLLAAPTVAAASKGPVAPEVDTEEMVEIPAGSFQMGVPLMEPGDYGDWWFIDQTPEHEVTLSAYRIDATEVTVREFALFLTYAGGEAHHHRKQPIRKVEGGYRPDPGKGEQAMRQVTWLGAKRYCRWAGKRLPTEAEWERAAAGTEGRDYPWGSEGPSCERAASYTGRSYCRDEPAAVGTHPEGATPSGIHDLAGNVAEWTGDIYGPYPSEPRTNPTGLDVGDYRVVRGGGFLENGSWLRTTARRAADPADRAASIGFRCVRTEETSAGDVRRGELSLPPDDGTPATEPPAPPAPTPEVVADGLDRPGPMVVFPDAGPVLLELDAGRVVTLESGGEVRTLHDGLVAPADIARDGDAVVVTDEAGDVWRIPLEGSAMLLAEGLDEPDALAVDEGGRIAWATASAVHLLGPEEVEPTTMAEGLEDVTALALTDDHLVFAERGQGEDTPGRVARVPLGGGEIQQLAGSDQIGNQLEPRGLALADGRLWVLSSLPGFPRHGFLCSAFPNGSSFGCQTYTPPRPEGPLLVAGGQLVWPGRGTVVRFDRADGATYRHVTTWTRPGGVAATSEHVWWTDRHTGELERTAR